MGLGRIFARGRALLGAKALGDVEAIVRGAGSIIVFYRRYTQHTSNIVDQIKDLNKAYKGKQEKNITVYRRQLLSSFQTCQKDVEGEMKGSLYVISGWTEVVKAMHEKLDEMEGKIMEYRAKGLTETEPLLAKIREIHQKIKDENKELMEDTAREKSGQKVFGLERLNKMRNENKLAEHIMKNAKALGKHLTLIEHNFAVMEKEAIEARGKSTKEEINAILEDLEKMEKVILEDIRKEYLTLMLKIQKSVKGQHKSMTGNQSKYYKQMLGDVYPEIISITEKQTENIDHTLAQAVDMLRSA